MTVPLSDLTRVMGAIHYKSEKEFASLREILCFNALEYSPLEVRSVAFYERRPSEANEACVSSFSRRRTVRDALIGGY